MRYETKFERQYERAYRGWVDYQNETRKNEMRKVSEPPPNLLERARAAGNMNLPDEPNPPSQTPQRSLSLRRRHKIPGAAAAAMPPGPLLTASYAIDGALPLYNSTFSPG